MRVAALLLAATSALAQIIVVVEGNPKSTIRVVAYEDLQCGDCAVYRKMMDEHLLPKYGNRAAFEHRDFPLPKHAWARKAAIAARHFDRLKPELGMDFRRWCLVNRRSITPENFEEKLQLWATEHKQDAGRAVAALSDRSLDKVVEADYQEGIARGVGRTPTVFVNGEPFIETFTVEEISKSIETALKQ